MGDAMSNQLQPPGPITINPTAVYTTYAVAWLLDTPPAGILAAIRRRELPAVRRGRQTYITGGSLLRWLSPSDTHAVETAVRA